MTSGVSRPSICFVAHNAYGAISGRLRDHVGGIEHQQALMARWLAARGHPITMLTWDEGQRDEEYFAGVRVLKMCSRSAGLRYVRFVYPRWTSLCGALRRAQADIYYYNCGDLGLGQIVWWCRRNGRRSVYSVASDPDCDARLPVLRPWRERVLYRYGLRHVDLVVVQTQRQRTMLAGGFGRHAAVLPMPCPDLNPQGRQRAAGPRADSVRILWVGRFSPEKRLEWLLALAERCPQWTFDVVGAANRGAVYGSALVERARRLPNVRLHGRVAHDRLVEFYLNATALCCTSAYEGFPNTFLEAFSVGLPVVTTFDPDGLIGRLGLGAVGRSVGELAGQLQLLLRYPGRWQAISASCRRYFESTHRLDVSMPRFEEVFRQLGAGRTATAPGTPELVAAVGR